MKNTNPVWYIVIALSIWCTWNSVGCNKLTSLANDVRTEQKVVLREVAHLMDRLQTLENIEPEVIVKEIIKEVIAEADGHPNMVKHNKEVSHN